MNREQIIRMAREAGWPDSLVEPIIMAKLSDFAKVVAAAEREACAGVAEHKGITWKARKYINPDNAEKAYMASQFIASAIRAREEA